MKVIKMPVAQKTYIQLAPYIDDKLTKFAAHSGDFVGVSVVALTASNGALKTALGQLSTLQAQVTAKVAECEALAAPVRVDANAFGDALEGVTKDPAILGNVCELIASGSPAHMEQVTHLNATMGDLDGEVDLSWDSQGRNVQLHEIQSSPDVMPRVWKNEPSCKPSKTTISGLTTGTQMVFRVRAKGANNTGDWSDIALCLVP